VNHKEAESALWLAWLARARLERAARGHDESDTEETFKAREKVGFRRWLAKNRTALPGFGPHGSRRPPRDQGGN
jgi:hypothetical protein